MRILFLCSSNVFRSQMAEAFFNSMTRNHIAESAALLKPQDKMHRLVVRAMKEESIDISSCKSKKVTDEMLASADIIILMSKSLESHIDYLKKVARRDVMMESWDVPDIIAKEGDEYLYPEFVKTRDMIKKKVLELLDRISKK